jgi:excisionase family DNA binding protein
MSQLERLLCSDEVSEVLMLHPKVVERMAARGELPALKVGRYWRYPPSALDAWVKSRLQSQRQPRRMETTTGKENPCEHAISTGR